MNCVVCDLPRKPYRDPEPAVDYCACATDYEDGAEVETDSFDDWRGNTVTAGDIIVYPVMSGRSALLAIGQVERIYVKRGYSQWEERLKVKRLERGRFGERATGGRETATLMYWERCMKFQIESPNGLGDE